MRAGDIPTIFLSYDEPWADAFWEDLVSKVPGAQRVHGVKGLDACHKAAARAAGGPRFISVDADTLVGPGLLDMEVPDEFLNDRCHLEWPSRNAVNGLVYGNGSLKCWSRRAALDMRTHEAAPPGTRSLDHDDMRATKVILPDLRSTTYPAETPYHGFRCGFREGVRLSQSMQAGTGGGLAFADALAPEPAGRLRAWCSLGSHAPNGAWAIYGARLGLWMAQCTEWSALCINDYGWFDRFWRDIVVARFSPGPATCRYTGFSWEPGVLGEAVAALGARIGEELNFELADFAPEASELVAGAPGPNLAFSMVDSIGNLYAKGNLVERNFNKAREMYEIGAILGVSGAVNNLARLHHLGLGVERDPAAAMRYYIEAIGLQNAFAPYHLATLLGEMDPDGPGVTQRREALARLSASRGYVPDQAPAQ